MKLTSIIFILLIHFELFSQDFNSLCNFETDGSGKSVGLKVKTKYPCNWIVSDGDRPHNIKKFSYSFGGGKFLNYVLTIKDLGIELSKTDKSEMFSLKEIKDSYKDYGEFKSYKVYKIDGEDCIEVVIKNKRESPNGTNYLYIIQYLILYQNKLITLGFSSGAKVESESNDLYTKYSILFKSLATNFVILSKWK